MKRVTEQRLPSNASDVAQFRATHDCRLTTKPGMVLRLKGQACAPKPDHGLTLVKGRKDK